MKNGHRYTEVERRQAKTDHILQNWQTKISSINSTNTFSFQNMKKCMYLYKLIVEYVAFCFWTIYVHIRLCGIQTLSAFWSDFRSGRFEEVELI
jgi:hypothetical protein